MQSGASLTFIILSAPPANPYGYLQIQPQVTKIENFPFDAPGFTFCITPPIPIEYRNPPIRPAPPTPSLSSSVVTGEDEDGEDAWIDVDEDFVRLCFFPASLYDSTWPCLLSHPNRKTPSATLSAHLLLPGYPIPLRKKSFLPRRGPWSPASSFPLPPPDPPTPPSPQPPQPTPTPSPLDPGPA